MNARIGDTSAHLASTSGISKRIVYLVLTLGLALLWLLSQRIGNSNLLTASLWAEDANVFMQQSHLGLQSLWMPYAGYFHLYPRLAALLASHAPLLATPLIFNIAWLCAYLGAAIALFHYTIRHTHSPLAAALLCLAFSVTPQGGETLFTLTNAQWYIGVALLLYMCHDDRKPLGLIGNTLLLVACLTGPFVVLGLPFVLLREFQTRGTAKGRLSYAIMVAGASVQVTVLLLIGRSNLSTPLDPFWLHWLHPYWAFLKFGASTTEPKIIAMIFWLGSILAIINKLIKATKEERVTIVSLILLAGLCLTAGLSAALGAPQILSPLGDGVRYFIIPYALSFFVIFISLPRKPYLSFIILAPLAATAFLLFSPVDRGEFQWKAFARFSGQVPDILIPVAPRVQVFPGWEGKTNRPVTPGATPYEIDIDHLRLTGLQHLQDVHELIATEADNQLSFDLPQCIGSRYVGILVETTRPQAGDVQIFWGTDFQFTEQDSLRRAYPAGAVTAQLAFKKARSDNTLRIDLSEAPGSVRLNRIRAYCLDSPTQTKTTH
jgi:hypothetical protein